MAAGRYKRITIGAVKLVIAVVVLWAVGRHATRVLGELRERGQSLRFTPGWLALSGALYLTGLAACGAFYQRVLQASAGPIGIGPALRAYLVSHLGKYVPGKAMVVVMRVGLSTPFGATATGATAATFYETLVMMASGCLIAAAGFAIPGGSGGSPVVGNLPGISLQSMAAFASLILGVLFLVATAPPVFGRTAGLIRKSLAGARPELLPRFSWRLMGEGLLITAAGWVLLGLSQFAVIRSFDHGATPGGLGLLPIVTAGVAFATAAGFVVAVLPGGLGVREGVLMSALAPAIGADRSVVAALVLRLVWVAAEGAAAVAVLPWLKAPASSPSVS